MIGLLNRLPGDCRCLYHQVNANYLRMLRSPYDLGPLDWSEGQMECCGSYCWLLLDWMHLSCTFPLESLEPPQHV